jgi:integrase
VSAPTPAVGSAASPRLLERLVAALRPEFRADMLSFPATDPVFGGGACRVVACSRSARGLGLCPGHHQRWADEGRPDLAVFAVTTDPRWRRQQPNRRCRVDGCGYGTCRTGLCQLHFQRWDRGGRPDLQEWLSAPPTVRQPPPGAGCRIEHCDLWPQATGVLCHAHQATWRASGRPDIDELVARFRPVADLADEVIHLAGLASQLRLEIQYALQCRRDDRASKIQPGVVMHVVRHLAAAGASSILQRSEDDWRAELAHHGSARCFLLYARRHVEDLADAGGWEAEFPRDVWLLRRLGRAGNETLDFTGIPQPWLRELVKRWLRGRLAAQLTVETVRRGLRSLTRFAAFCERIGVTSLAQVDRGVLERYLADLHAEWAGRQRHNDHIGQLGSLLQAIRQHRWDDTLPATALLFSDDQPKRTRQLPRALGEQVMLQVEQSDNLNRWNNPAFRLVTVILIRCGLRVTDALRLRRDCLVSDAEGAPYLRYLNHKMKREALVPIDEELRGLIGEQQARVKAALVLFPRPTKNPEQRFPSHSTTYRAALYRWLDRCDLRDEHGRPVRLTPHQWRHTLGTRLINRDVPQEVVRRILDHDSAEMTAHYARLNDTTVRRHWEAARKVDITGQTVTLDQNGPLAEAAWAKQRLGRATQALANGFCGLPVQNSCPHANACLTCPMFLTTAQFLPQHRAQRTQLLQIITAAEARGQTRLVEMNRQVLTNLDRIITGLREDDVDTKQVSDAG